MGTQEGVLVEIKSVVHRPRGMMGGYVQRFEVMAIVLDFGAFDDVESNVLEELANAPQRQSDRMEPSRTLPAPRQGNVDGFPLETFFQLARLQNTLSGLQIGYKLVFGPINPASGLPSLFRRKRTEFFHALGKYTFLAEIMYSHLIEFSERIGLGHLLSGLHEKLFKGCTHSLARLDNGFEMKNGKNSGRVFPVKIRRGLTLGDLGQFSERIFVANSQIRQNFTVDFDGRLF